MSTGLLLITQYQHSITAENGEHTLSAADFAFSPFAAGLAQAQRYHKCFTALLHNAQSRVKT